jgi:hypothetical protein
MLGGVCGRAYKFFLSVFQERSMANGNASEIWNTRWDKWMLAGNRKSTHGEFLPSNASLHNSTTYKIANFTCPCLKQKVASYPSEVKLNTTLGSSPSPTKYK